MERNARIKDLRKLYRLGSDSDSSLCLCVLINRFIYGLFDDIVLYGVNYGCFGTKLFA